jgi:hypothetical protein
MVEQEFNEVDDEKKRARGGKRTSETKNRRSDHFSLAKRWQNKGRNEDLRLDPRDCVVNIAARQTASLCGYGYWHTAGRRLDT